MWGGAYSRITCSLATVQSGSQTGGLARQANCHLLDVLCLNNATRTSSGKRAGSTQHQHLQPSLECPLGSRSTGVGLIISRSHCYLLVRLSLALS